MKFTKNQSELAAAADEAADAVRALRHRCTAPLDEVIATMQRIGALELAVAEVDAALAAQVRLFAKSIRDFPPFLDFATIAKQLAEVEQNIRAQAGR
jgi:hypothetical protein